MAAKVDPSASAESRHVQSTGSMSTSANSPKISMFGAKSGFVIPKNKLSGSLVPIFQRGGKLEGGNSIKEETTKQVQRKTKWGPDLTLDAAVRKGRALAYQTRLEQITQQLKQGHLEIKDNQSPLSIKQNLDDDSDSHQIDKETSKLELLELERREVIGEILRLNPSYKPPADYKPLLKEADIPIPIKVHPGYNFVGLLLGPESNTQKRLEEETGAKVRVYGTKKDTGEKHEITHSDKSEAADAYEELHVNISADTYEKVDTAVALIELLFTPVSGTTAVSSTSSTSLVTSNLDNADVNLKEMSSSYMIMTTSDVNQGVAPPILLTAQPSPLQYQPFTAPWLPIAPPNLQSHLSSVFVPSLPNNSVRFPPRPFGGLQHTFGSMQSSSSAVASGSQFPMQAMQQPLNQAPPPNNLTGQQPPAYPNMLSNVPSFAASQPLFSRAVHASSHVASLSPQPIATAPEASLTSRPLTTLPPAGNSGWSTAPQFVPLLQRPALLPSSAPLMRPPLVVSSPAIATAPNVPSNVSRPPAAIGTLPLQPNMPTNETNRPLATNFAPPTAFPSRPSASQFTSVLQTGAPLSTPMPSSTPVPPHMPSPAPRPMPMLPGIPAPVPRPPAVFQSAAPLGGSNLAMTQASVRSQPLVTLMGQAQIPLPSKAPVQSSMPVQPPGSLPQLAPVTPISLPGVMPGFSHVTHPPNTVITTPPVAVPKPPRPISADFTFRPLGAQVPASPTPLRPNVQTAQQMTAVAAPQPPSFRPALQNSASSINTQGFPRPLAVNQTNPSQAPIHLPPSSGVPFSVDLTMVRPPPNLPAFSDTNSIRLTGPSRQMGPGFSSAAQSSNPPRMPAWSMPIIQTSQNQLRPANRPNSPAVPMQQLGANHPGYMAGVASSNAGGNQIYDPFSPTSVSSAPRKAEENHTNMRKTETDAEYEDLMTSVGVK
ncbi:hypothetical protein C4D60_Mb06t04860 [Musa balbisiana]|uniref:K Homology domain-containing protein n=1 Tax=Musa balbisiana TaxID=52838 RepID=A0A4S8IKU5_MUSBA|nr:hypothetical protein C4D60_Mb06t04860 [Musa balbisiana]